MNRSTTIACAVALSLSAAAASHAAPIYATTVIDFTPGTYQKVLPGRSDAAAALGAEDGSFVSLGFGGSIILGFAQPFKAIGQVLEVTFNNKAAHKETADVFGSADGVTWTLLASLKNHLSTSFSAAGIFTQLKIVDTSNAAGATFDGFDIDAVSVLPSPVPVPAAGLLLAGGLFGLGALRRRRAQKA